MLILNMSQFIFLTFHYTVSKSRAKISTSQRYLTLLTVPIMYYIFYQYLLSKWTNEKKLTTYVNPIATYVFLQKKVLIKIFSPNAMPNAITLASDFLSSPCGSNSLMLVDSIQNVLFWIFLKSIWEESIFSNYLSCNFYCKCS